MNNKLIFISRRIIYYWNAFNACGPFTKNKEKYKNSKKQEIYHIFLDKACFQHDMADGDFKNLTKRMASDKILRDKAFNIAKNPKYGMMDISANLL